YPMSRAAAALRHRVKDPDAKVRFRAGSAVRRLGLDDVGLPDIRFPAPWRGPGGGGFRPDPLARGGWNPSGWSFGIQPPSPTRRGRLADHGLPEIERIADLAALLGTDAEAITRLTRPGVAAGAPYVEFAVAKARGGQRRIAAPRAELKGVQRRLLDRILSRVPV